MEKYRIGIIPFGLSIWFLLATESLMPVFMNKFRANPMLVLGGVRILETLMITGLFAFRQEGLAALGLGRNQIRSGLENGVVWSLGFAGAAAFIGIILILSGINPLKFIRVRLPSEPEKLALFFLVGGFIGPVAEEVAFRGVVYGFLRRWGKWFALFGSTAVFVLLHPGFGGITQIVGGMVFALAYETSGKLMTPVTIHVLGNMALFALSLPVFRVF